MNLQSKVLGTAVALLAACARGGARAPTPLGDVVRVEGGALRGVVTGGVASFKGVPFAAPPVGDLRWRAPRPAARWGGVRAADRFSASCVQPAPAAFGPWTLEFLLRGPVSEDCLYLNVWTAGGPNERRPVFVFVHGGGFTSGSGDVPVYDGARLAAKGLVAVTINYRVGSLGFLAHPELTAESPERASGNYGLLDQVAALEWVKRNIAAFGGDPARVTVAGQSAGAMSVFLLTASPRARGLFQRAIIESGPGGLAAMGVATSRSSARPRADAERDGVTFATALGARSLAELRALPASTFATPRARMGPVIDGAFLTEDPSETFAAGRQNDVPTLTGMNADEGSASPGYGKATVEAFRRQVEQRFGARAADVLARYPATTDEEARRSAVASARDAALASLHRLLVERARTARTPAFEYYFDHAIPWPERPEFGAFHTSEVPYVFGTLDALPRPWTDVDRRLSETMMAYWINFATRGDPNGPGLPAWPAFDPGQPTVMQLGDRVGPRPSVAREAIDLFTH